MASFPKPYPNYSNPSGDGRNLIELAPLYFTDDDGEQYRSIVGATTDGASSPSPVWSYIPPNGGPWFLPAEWHDNCYRCQTEKLMADGTWQRIFIPKDTADSMLLRGMTAMGVDEVRKLAIYEAVSKAGQNAYLGDLAQPIVMPS